MNVPNPVNVSESRRTCPIIIVQRFQISFSSQHKLWPCFENNTQCHLTMVLFLCQSQSMFSFFFFFFCAGVCEAVIIYCLSICTQVQCISSFGMLCHVELSVVHLHSTGGCYYLHLLLRINKQITHGGRRQCHPSRLNKKKSSMMSWMHN